MSFSDAVDISSCCHTKGVAEFRTRCLVSSSNGENE
uniref:Uncharacterized protein n=1 Tax=Arundo donax TaxID=35708 RepID=A0A0A9GIT7_ARUDO